MCSRFFAHLYFLSIATCLPIAVFGQNIIKSSLAAGITDLSSKTSDLKTDGSNYGIGYGYYGTTPLQGYGLNYGNSIVATTPYLSKYLPYPSNIPTGYFPAAYTITGKPAIPHNGYIPSNYGYTPNLALSSHIGYRGVLGYGNVYDHHSVVPPHPIVPPHNYHGYHPYTNGYVG